jgi:soluble lytic murein transglycosylase-like protein
MTQISQIVLDIKAAAMAEGIDPELFQAICTVESSLIPSAVRFEYKYKWHFKPEEWAKKYHFSSDTERAFQSFSYSLPQIMGAVMREYGFAGNFQELLKPDADHRVALQYGAKHLKRFLIRHKNMDEAIAAYNAGSPRYRADGKFENQGYVDKVNAALKSIRAKV